MIWRVQLTGLVVKKGQFDITISPESYLTKENTNYCCTRCVQFAVRILTMIQENTSELINLLFGI